MSTGPLEDITLLRLDVSEGPTSGRVDLQTRLDIKHSSLNTQDSVQVLMSSEIFSGKKIVKFRDDIAETFQGRFLKFPLKLSAISVQKWHKTLK